MKTVESWQYSQELSKAIEKRLKRFVNKANSDSLNNRKNWYIRGFYDGWRAALEQQEEEAREGE